MAGVVRYLQRDCYFYILSDNERFLHCFTRQWYRTFFCLIRTHPGLSVPEAPVPEAETPAAEEERGAPAGKVKRSLSLPRATSPPPLLPPKRVKSEQALSAGKAKAPGRRTFFCPAQSLNVICAAILGQSMGVRNRVGIGLSYRPARLHRLAESTPWELIPGLLKSLKIRALFSRNNELELTKTVPHRLVKHL
jgi:hypothetical protein